MYLSRSKGGRGLLGVQDTLETATLRLRNYVRNSKERLLIAARKTDDNEDRGTPHEYKKKKKEWKKNKVDTKTIKWTVYQANKDKASEDW